MSLPVSRLKDSQDDQKEVPSSDSELIEDLARTTETFDPTSKGDRAVATSLLRPPTSQPIRPLSPDSVSNLSIDEYDLLRSDILGEAQDVSHLSPPSASRRRAWRVRLDAFWIRNKGLAFMLVAQIFGTLMNVTTRLLEVEGNHGNGMHPFQILFARMGITVVLASLWMWWNKTPYFPFGRPEIRWLLVARGFAGFFGVFGMYYSLLYLPLSDATVITFLAPGLACWACSILINEPFTRAEQMATFISLIGVVLIARPTALFAAFNSEPTAIGEGDMMPGTNFTMADPHPSADASAFDSVTPMQRLSAVGVAMLGVLGAATAYTTIRWIGKRAHPLISVNYFATWCTFVSIVAQLTLPGVGFLLPATAKDWAYLTFLGTCGFILQFLMATALSYEKSSRATNMTYTQMLFALTFDKVIFGHTPGWISIIGSSLILGSALYVAVQQGVSRTNQPHDSGRRISDEESQRGLISGTENETYEMNMNDRMPVQEVHLRTLR